MRVRNEVRLLGLLVFVTLLANVANGLPTEILPESSHYEGRSYYNIVADGLTGRVDFAVYDTLAYPDEYIGADGFVNPGTGQYIYAYQVFNSDASVDVASFAISSYLGMEPGSGGAQDDLAGGIAAIFNSSEEVWEFDGGLMYAGEHSYFLILSSEYDWVEGDYTITPAGSDPVSVPPIPEPGTVALLGLGGLAFLRRRKTAK